MKSESLQLFNQFVAKQNVQNVFRMLFFMEFIFKNIIVKINVISTCVLLLLSLGVVT